MKPRVKPFTAWLAMGLGREVPRLFASTNRSHRREYVLAYTTEEGSLASEEMAVLIVADTEENRKKLGMEE